MKIFTFTLQYPSFLFPGKTQYSSEKQPENLDIVRTLSSANPFSWLKTARLIAKESPDAVVLRFWMPYFGPSLGTVGRYLRRRGIKVVSLVDNIIPHDKKPGDKIFARFFAKSVDGFMAMSYSVLDELKAFEQTKPAVFSPHPLYDQYYATGTKEESCAALGLDPTKDYYLFFGLIRDYKGLDLLLQAMSCEKLKDSKAELIVAGEFYSNEEKYRGLAHYLALEERIHWFPEFIADNQVCHYFIVSDLIVQPYKTATQSGITQIAYSFDKPMVVTRVGGLAEIVPDGKCGYVVAPNPDAIADAIADFYTRRPDFSAGIALQKKEFSWSRMTENLLKLISLTAE